MQQTNLKTPIRKGLEEGAQSQAFPRFILHLYGYLEKDDLALMKRTVSRGTNSHRNHLQFANQVRKKGCLPVSLLANGQSALGVPPAGK